jgi:hypothetical protein
MNAATDPATNTGTNTGTNTAADAATNTAADAGVNAAVIRPYGDTSGDGMVQVSLSPVRRVWSTTGSAGW